MKKYQEKSIPKERFRNLHTRFLFLLLFMFMSLLAYSQTQITKGTVYDSSNDPIIGASVTIKGTTKATMTDVDGKFSIETSRNDVLIVSYIGFSKKEVPVNNQNNLSIILEENRQVLDEVVVVGYGTQKKTTLTGAVSAINNKEISTTKNESLVNMMTGKIPGVRVVQRSSEPGSFNNRFDIRGLGNPLVVIDGVPRDDFARMDPNEIESISVLKDASAAIYGVRAANGVILITTRKGNSEGSKFDITYSANFGFQQPIGFPNSTDAIQYMTLKNEASRRNFNNNYVNPVPLPYGESEFEAFNNGTRVSSDWRGAVMRDITPQSQHSLNMAGSSKNISYFFNLGYMKQDGITKTKYPNYDKWNVRANVDAKITSFLRSEFRVAGMMDERNDINGGSWNLIKNTWLAKSTESMYANNNPLYPTAETDENPLLLMDPNKSGYFNNKGRSFQSSLALIFDVPGVKGLSAKAMYSYDYKDNDWKNYVRTYSLYKYDTGNDTYNEYVKNTPSKVARGFGKNISNLMQLSLNYDRTFFEKHNVKALFLYEESGNEGDNFNAQRNLSLEVLHLFAGDADGQVAGMDAGGLYDQQRKSFVGRINYDYASKYLLEFSFRRDGSSKFSSNGRWGWFPSASAGWRISEEKFVKEFEPLSFINNLKIRSSYGEMGDDGALNYQFLTGYDYPSGGAVFGGEFINGIGFRGIANTYLTWYTSKTFNIGVDIDLWDGLLGFQYDYFIRKREGLFTDRLLSLPGTYGAKLPQENLNSDKTMGYEVVLTHRNKVSDFVYNVSANMSLTRTKNDYFEQGRAGNSYEHWKGNYNNRYKNIWWGQTYGGQFTSYDQILNYDVNAGGGNHATLPGDYYYKDLNGDGVIDGWDETPIATRELPYINYGITLAAEYKGIDINMLFQGTAKSWTRYYEMLNLPLAFDKNTLDFFMDRWHPTDPNADVYDPNTEWTSGFFPMTGNGSAWGEGTRAVQNAAYLRLKSIELGYTLPKKLTTKVGVSNARIYVNAYNLFTLTGLKYIDPEHPGGGADANDKPENDLYGYMYPLTRTYNVGFSLTF